MVTRSDGCGMRGRSSLTSWYCVQARWNEDTAIQDKCFGWACNRQSLVLGQSSGRQTDVWPGINCLFSGLSGGGELQWKCTLKSTILTFHPELLLAGDGRGLRRPEDADLD